MNKKGVTLPNGMRWHLVEPFHVSLSNWSGFLHQTLLTVNSIFQLIERIRMAMRMRFFFFFIKTGHYLRHVCTVNSFSIQIGALAFARCIQLVVWGNQCGANHNFFVHTKRNDNAEHRYFVHKIRCAIDRIDNPSGLVGQRKCFHRFFSQKPEIPFRSIYSVGERLAPVGEHDSLMMRILFLNAFAQQIFDGFIVISDQIPWALFRVHLTPCCIETFHCQFARFRNERQHQLVDAIEFGCIDCHRLRHIDSVRALVAMFRYFCRFKQYWAAEQSEKHFLY